MGVNIEDKELVKMFNPTLKRRETILFFLIMVINGLKCIVSDIGLDTCARGRWRVEVLALGLNTLCRGWAWTRKGVLSGGALGLNTLCRGCSSHTTNIFRYVISFIIVIAPTNIPCHWGDIYSNFYERCIHFVSAYPDGPVLCALGLGIFCFRFLVLGFCYVHGLQNKTFLAY